MYLLLYYVLCCLGTFSLLIILSVCVCVCFSVKQVAELGEIEYIENLPLLRVLNLLRNPVRVRRPLF